MYLGILLIVVAKIIPVAAALGYCINKLIFLADYLIFKIQAFPFAVTERLYINKPETAFLYIIIIIISIYFANANKNYLKIAIVFTIVLILNFSLRKYYNDRQQQVVLNSISGSFSLNIINGRSNELFCDSNLSGSQIKLRTHFKGFWNSCGLTTPRIENITQAYQARELFFNSSYLITPHASFYFVDENTSLANKFKVTTDYVVLCRNCKISLKVLKRHFHYKYLVFDGSLKSGRKNKYIIEAIQLHENYYDLLTNGAIIISF